MKAIRVHQFGGIDALVCEDVDQPTPGAGQVLVRVEAAGVGPWDAWVRNGSSAVAQRLPLTPGADLLDDGSTRLACRLLSKRLPVASHQR